MQLSLNNMNIEKWKRERKYNSRILWFLLACILIALFLLAVIDARAENIARYNALEKENIGYINRIKTLLIEKEALMKRLIKAKNVELKSVLEKAIYFKAVELKNRSNGEFMKPSYLKLEHYK